MNSIMRVNRSTALQYAVLIFLALIALGPIIVMFVTSFKTQVDIMSGESMWVFQPTFDNYTHVFENKFDLFLRNSIIVSLASTALSLLVAGMAAYALARLEFPGRSPIAYFTLIIRMVPPAVLAIPIFILWLNWELFLFDLIDATPFLYELENPDPYLFAEGLVDGRIGLTLFYTALNLPFAIWLLIGFLRQIPTEIEEAAIVDGCSQWQVFTRIIFPFRQRGIAESMTLEGLPLFKPPYSRMTAIDMSRGDIVWQSAMGNGPRNHPLLQDLDLPPLGNESMTTSVLVTKSLIFGTMTKGRTPDRWGDEEADRQLMYAFDKQDGTHLRTFLLDGRSAAAPMTYMHEGKQYIVVAIGSANTAELVALSLP